MMNVQLGTYIALLLFLQITAPSVGYSVLDCDFDTADPGGRNCNWTDPVGTSWFRANSDTAQIDPGHDHTCSVKPAFIPFGDGPVRKCGIWLSTLPPSNYSGQQEFKLISPQVSPTTAPTCFTFWYHFFGVQNANFEVQINDKQNDFNARTLWEKLRPQSNNWVQGQVTIPPQDKSPFYVIFHAVLNSIDHDTVGLDDISLTIGACPPTPACDFEIDSCTWSVNAGQAQRTNGTPIAIDHTVGSSRGHYMYSRGGQQSTLTSSMSDLTSRFTNHVSRYCLKFWYYFSYQAASRDAKSYISVNITTFTTSFISSYKRLLVTDAYSDGLTNKWRPFYMSLQNPRIGLGHNNSQLIITLNSAVTATEIALDDVLLQNDDCEAPGECDFESDLCAWFNTGLALWLRNQGGNRNGFKKAPTTDTTTHSPTGWFAMIPAEYLSRSVYATLQSPPLNGNMYGCISFSYWAVGPNSNTAVLTVNFNDLTKPGHLIAQYTVNSTTFQRWQYFHQKLPKLPAKFSVTINTNYVVRTLQSDIAIDDIDLDSDDCDDDRPWRPTTTTTTPVPYTERKWDCAFQYNCPEWTSDSSWIKTSYREVDSSVDAPRNDHTYNTPEGKYLLWMPTSANSQTQSVSTINSSIITTSTNRVHCFSFWYFDSSEILFDLKVQLRTPSYTVQLRSVRPNVATRSWKLVKVDVRSYLLNSFITISFTTSRSLNGSFALDDFQLRPGVCGHIDDYVYTFDSDDNFEVNRISPLQNGRGTEYNVANKNYPQAPAKDHTTGTGSYFLFANLPNDANVIYRTELEIGHLPSMRRIGRSGTQQRCLRFAYQIAGNASLRVSLDSEDGDNFGAQQLFTAFGAHVNAWAMAQKGYTAYFEHKIVFTMSKPFDMNSYVALDDISISSHHCLQPVECDFDDDVCSYSTRLNKADFDFARFVGPPLRTNWPGPAFDHTKRGYGGGYLYMTGYPSYRDTSRYSSVQTPIESFNRIYANYCVSFWSQLTQPDAVLTITLGLYGGADPSKDFTPGTSNTTYVKLLELANLTESKWTRHYVQIDKTLLTNFHEYNLLIAGRTSNAKTVISLDDIELVRSSCDFALKFKCNDKTLISADKICDFRKDCKNGEDEEDCGECNFEKGWGSHSNNNDDYDDDDDDDDDDDACNWGNQTDFYSYNGPSPDTSYEGAWVPVAASAVSGTAPKVDGNGNSSGHYLLLSKRRRSSTQSFIASTTLTRNYHSARSQLKDAYHTCMLTFDYYIASEGRKYPSIAFAVRIGNDQDSSALKFYSNKEANEWQHAQVRVGGFTGSFIVEFTGSASTNNETVALDNIKFQNCSIPDPIGPKDSCPASAFILCNSTRICIEPGDLCDFEDNCGDNWDERYDLCQIKVDPTVAPSCAFEKSVEYCGFSSDAPLNGTDKVFNWQYTRGYDYNMIGYSGPGADHTTKDPNGQFMILRTYKKEFIGQRAQLYSSMMTSSGDDCILRFFYYNDGNASAPVYNALKVWAQYADGSQADSDTLFTSNAYARGWIKAKVHHSSGAPFRFVFDGQLGDRGGSISLDDVSFSGTCVQSTATRTPGTPHSSTAVTVILALLFVGLASGIAFFAYRKHKSGELEPFIRRFIPARSGPSPSDKRTFVSNQNFESN